MTMTTAELALTRKLGECYNEYRALLEPTFTAEGDINEFAHHVHILQRQVMCRVAQRAHPNEFRRGRAQVGSGPVLKLCDNREEISSPKHCGWRAGAIGAHPCQVGECQKLPDCMGV